MGLTAHRFVIADLAGVEQGEAVGASDKTYVPRPIGTMGTAGFRVPLEFDQSDFLLGGDALLKVYAEGSRIPTGRQLMGHYGLVTAEEQVGQRIPSAATTWADPFWVLLRRLAGKSKQGYSRGTALAPVDPTDIISDMLATTNAEDATGLVMGAVGLTAPTYVSGWYYKPIGQSIAELTGSLGPDWRVRPQEYSAGVIGLLDVSGALGVNQADAVFEHGDGLVNVTGYRRLVSKEGTANRAFHLPPGFPDAAQQDVKTSQDVASQTARGLLESVVSADLSVDDLRQKLLDYHILVRKGPRTTITFDAVRDVAETLPLLGVDYDTGDVVGFRASAWIKGVLTKRIDSTVRVYQAAFAVGPDGAATPTLTVTPP